MLAGNLDNEASSRVSKSVESLTGSKSSITEEKLLKEKLSTDEITISVIHVEDADSETILQDNGSDECTVEKLLIRNTPSFRCFINIAVSDSSLFKSKWYLFPPLEDPGIDEVYFFQEQIKQYDNIGTEKYKDLCKELQIFPFGYVKRNLNEETMNLKYYILTPKQMKAICKTLATNAQCNNLILEGNHLNIEQVTILTSMMEENTALKNINLNKCLIGEEGAKHLSDGIAASQALLELDLSHNCLGDEGLCNLLPGLCQTPSLMKLDISNNQLTEDCAETLETILLKNNTLRELNLSWNFINTGPICKRVFRAILSTDLLKSLMLAWNGLSAVPAVSPITRYVTRSKVLEHFDISNNRLKDRALRRFRTAILKNHSLITVKIGNNPFPPDQAYSVASLLTAKTSDPLDYLDMENIWFTKEIVQLISKINNLGKRIKIGGILGNYSIIGPNIDELLFKRCKYLLMKPKKKKAKIDFGHFILQLPDEIITKSDFESLLKKKKIRRLDKDLLTELLNRFTVKKVKVDCNEMRKQYMKHWPDTVLPPPKEKKKKKRGKKGKKNKTFNEPEKELAVHEFDGQPDIPVIEDNIS